MAHLPLILCGNKLALSKSVCNVTKQIKSEEKSKYVTPTPYFSVCEKSMGICSKKKYIYICFFFIKP